MLAIVPVKGLESAKTRLAPLLGDAERTALVVAMLDDVLAACRDATAIDRTLVVTPDARIARGHDMLIDDGAGHAQAVALALADPRARDGAIVVMADCPLVQPESLDTLAEAAKPVALAPSRDGGMNALALADPTVLDPAFGVPDAAAATIARARARGLDPVVIDDPLLALDIDRPADVARFHELVLAETAAF